MVTAVEPKCQVSRSAFCVEWAIDDFPSKDAAHALSVLVVAAGAKTREIIGNWVAEKGHEVTECPGPKSPDFTCIGGRGGSCPLAKGADVVVIDLDLPSDSVVGGTPSWKLVDYYISGGHPVVAVSGDDDTRWFLDNRVVSLKRPVDRQALVEAVDYLGARRSSVSDIGTFRLTPRGRNHRPN